MSEGICIEVSAALRARVATVAAAQSSSPSTVYLAALAWLFRDITRDVCIETAYNPHLAHGGNVQGPMAAWTLARINSSPYETLRELIVHTEKLVTTIYEHSPIEDYFNTVPSELRRFVYNYIPIGKPHTNVMPGLVVTPMTPSPPPYKRHYDMDLMVLALPQRTILEWSGQQQLFRAETIRGVAERYVTMLERELA